MQVIDGKLYPPMAASVGKKLVDPIQLGKWEQADEHPELIKVEKNAKGEEVYKFVLDKGGKDATGKDATKVPAAYNPYIHTSRSILNDQFKSAWIRPNFVTVEVEVPVSELTSGYKAQYAKDAVGEVEWKSGSASTQLAKVGKTRRVILSRYDRPVRVLSTEEVASKIADLIGDSGISIPENVVTPVVREALEKKGITITGPEKGVNKTEQIAEALENGLNVDNNIRYSLQKDGAETVTKELAPENLNPDTKFSLKMNDTIMNGALKANTSGKGVSYGHADEATLKAATDLSKKVADRLEGLKMFLPADNPGQVLKANGSYGRSAENSLICPRSLVSAYFMDNMFCKRY